MNRLPRILLSVAIGILFSFVSAINPGLTSVLLILLLGLFLTELRLQHLYYKKPIRLSEEGHYNDALSMFKKSLDTGKVWFRLRILKQEIIVYSIAVAYARMGEFESSITWLERIDLAKIPNISKSSYYGMYALNLLRLGRSFEVAENYLNEAVLLGKLPMFDLVFCYLYLLKNDLEKATEHVKIYLDNPEKRQRIYKQGTVRIKVDQTYFTGMENFYLGLYYQAMNDVEQAKEHFFAAALMPYDNFIKREAHRLYNSIV